MLFKINLVQYNVSGFLYRVAMGVVLGFHYIVYFLGPLGIIVFNGTSWNAVCLRTFSTQVEI